MAVDNLKNKIEKFILKIFGGGWLLTLFLILLTSCQSADKTESYMNRSGYEVSYVYDETSNQTKVVWGAYITNDTIYSIDYFSAKFDLYKDDTYIEEVNYYWNAEIKHGDTYSHWFNFVYDGEVTNAEFVSWTAHYLSVWDTYSNWFIGTIVVVLVVFVIYIVLLLIICLPFKSVWKWLRENYWFLLISPGTIVTLLIAAFSSNFEIQAFILIGGAIAVLLLMLFAHFIRYFIQDRILANDPATIKRKEEMNKSRIDSYIDAYISDNLEKVEDYLDNPQKLDELFTVNELKKYCKDSGYTDYHRMTKKQLITLITSGQDTYVDIAKENKIKQQKDKKDKKTQKKKGVRFDDIAGLEDVKEAFKEKVILPFEHPEIFEKFGKKAGGGILLYGLPGTGKTMFAEAASNEVDALFIPVKCSDIKSKWYGESEQNVKAIFEQARKAKRSIIFFDEFEAIGAKRSDSSENGNNDLVPEILAEMQGIGTNKTGSTIVVIAATNKPWNIDSAFMRPGRFDEKIYVPLPDETARRKLIELQLKKVPIEDDFDFDHMVKITDGFNGADIKEACEKLKMCVIKRSIGTEEEQEINNDDLKKIETSIKSSVSAEDIYLLEEFEKGI